MCIIYDIFKMIFKHIDEANFVMEMGNFEIS